ncbi:hypothetical protein J5N97_027110 [Dioscorea zingiberensis]|uniref:Pepsin inhibitor-3-like repeated domain-containing protein n=1 Tax=Dioscorea zingiberensis TaxID=325984 RepID=A0A9D5H7G5_9LILI|nr:hypothetical protein J5N97_027110 [Dioscorea zingiberensis]
MFLLWLLLFSAIMAQGVLSLEGTNDERSSLKGGTDVSLCANGGVLCSGAVLVKNRKLMIKDGTEREDHLREKHEKDRYRFDLQHKQKQYSTAETYPDAIDIAGMDYSPAKRKPPIHN